MYDSSQDVLAALRAAPTVLEGLLRDCTQEQAQRARGGDEEWSVVIAAHDTVHAAQIARQLHR